MNGMNVKKIIITFLVFNIICATALCFVNVIYPKNSEDNITNDIECVEVNDNEHLEEIYFTGKDALMLAKVAYCEARGISSQTEIACVMWTILNRYDANYASTIEGVITAPNQFAYNSNANTVTDYGVDLYDLAYDVLCRWNAEKNGDYGSGRVLPSDYLWYSGDGSHNYFRNQFRGGSVWDYTLTSPYTD